MFMAAFQHEGRSIGESPNQCILKIAVVASHKAKPDK